MLLGQCLQDERCAETWLDIYTGNIQVNTAIKYRCPYHTSQVSSALNLKLTKLSKRIYSPTSSMAYFPYLHSY